MSAQRRAPRTSPFWTPTDGALNGTWATATSGEAKSGKATILMPCQGSGGAGETMSFTITITAMAP